MLLYFPPHLINATTLPCETETWKLYLFTLMLYVDLPIDTQVTSQLSYNNCWTIFHS